MKTIMVTKRKQRVLFDKLEDLADKIEAADEAGDDLEAKLLVAQEDAIFDCIDTLGLMYAYWEYHDRRHIFLNGF